MQKKDRFAPPALLAGGAASLIFFENGSRIVQYLQPRGIFRFFRQNTPAIAEGEAGVFVGQVAVQRRIATLAKQVLSFQFFRCRYSATKQPNESRANQERSINK